MSRDPNEDAESRLRDLVVLAAISLDLAKAVPFVAAEMFAARGWLRGAAAMIQCRHAFRFSLGEAYWTIEVDADTATAYPDVFDGLLELVDAYTPFMSAIDHIVVRIERAPAVDRLARLRGAPWQSSLFDEPHAVEMSPARPIVEPTTEGAGARWRSADLGRLESIPDGEFVTWPVIVVNRPHDEWKGGCERRSDTETLDSFMVRYGAFRKRTYRVERTRWIRRCVAVPDGVTEDADLTVTQAEYGPGERPSMGGPLDGRTTDSRSCWTAVEAADFIAGMIDGDTADGRRLRIRIDANPTNPGLG